MCRKHLSSPRCRSKLIDSAWVVLVPGQKYIKKCTKGSAKDDFEILESPVSILNKMVLFKICSLTLAARCFLPFIVSVGTGEVKTKEGGGSYKFPRI